MEANEQIPVDETKLKESLFKIISELQQNRNELKVLRREQSSLLFFKKKAECELESVQQEKKEIQMQFDSFVNMNKKDTNNTGSFVLQLEAMKREKENLSKELNFSQNQNHELTEKNAILTEKYNLLTLKSSKFQQQFKQQHDNLDLLTNELRKLSELQKILEEKLSTSLLEVNFATETFDSYKREFDILKTEKLYIHQKLLDVQGIISDHSIQMLENKILSLKEEEIKEIKSINTQIEKNENVKIEFNLIATNVQKLLNNYLKMNNREAQTQTN